MTIEIPFFTSKDSLLEAISRCNNGIEALKLLDSIQKLESKIINSYNISNFYNFSPFRENLITLTFDVSRLTLEISQKLASGCILDMKEKSYLKKKVKLLNDFEKEAESLYELAMNDSIMLSLVITLFKYKIKNKNQKDVIFEVSAIKIKNNTASIDYTLNATDISKSNILEQCNNFINSTVLRR